MIQFLGKITQVVKFYNFYNSRLLVFANTFSIKTLLYKNNQN